MLVSIKKANEALARVINGEHVSDDADYAAMAAVAATKSIMLDVSRAELARARASASSAQLQLDALREVVDSLLDAFRSQHAEMKKLKTESCSRSDEHERATGEYVESLAAIRNEFRESGDDVSATLEEIGIR